MTDANTLLTLIGKRVPVLDRGYVELQDLMPHPATGVAGDLAIISAARTSFMGEGKGDEKDRKLLHYLMRNAHTSPFEMVEFKFRLKAPLVTWWQLVRHRMASLNMQSGRYVEFEDDEYYVPAVWRKQSASNKQASDGVIDPDDDQALTAQLVEHYEHSYNLYQQALAKGVAREMARLFLPGFAVYYTGVWKIDVHNLMRTLHLRMATDAQEEIRVYATAMYEHFFKPALPWTAEAFEKYVLNKAEA
jgi:thymidylate synthase (FAD)